MFRIVTLLVVFFTLLISTSGTYLRAVQSTVPSCTDFLGCTTQISDVFSQAMVSSHDVVWLIHSLSSFSVVILLGMMLLTAFWVKASRLVLTLGSCILIALVAVQVQLGMHQEWLGTQALNHFVHYLLSVLLLYGAFYLYLHSHVAQVKRRVGNTYWLVYSAMLLLALQLVLGAWLAANNAGLVCGGFPQCLNSWWPQADYQNAFNLFVPLSFSAKVALHWVHRLFSVLIFISLTGLMLSATSSRIKQLRWSGLAVSILLLIQVGAGIAIVKLAMPAWIAVIHSFTAMLLMLPLIIIGFYAKYQSLDESDVRLKAPEHALVEQIPPQTEGAVELDSELSLDVSQLEVLKPEPDSLYLRLKAQLGKTRTGLGAALSAVSLGNRKIDQGLLEELETSLLMADVGMDVTTGIIAKLQENVEKHQLQDASALSALLKQQLLELLEPVSQPLVVPKQQGPYVILVVGVNGVGKTTTIGKLAQRLQRQGHSVMLAAGDTFRAAAVEQLQTWGERNQIHVVAQHTGADSASVIFDGVQSAQAKGIDVLIADTAGRLHTKSNLMEELKKVKRIMAKLDVTAPHEVLLVLDAGTGQNALSQAEHFNKTVELTGIALTKLDGTAKGGIIFALAKQMGVPIRFLGVGEGIDDLQDFNAAQFIDALFVDDER